MPLLEIKNLHVEVDGKKILNGLDLTVEKGTVHAIMGPNGSGKSTLAHVLAGKAGYDVTEGQVLFNGEDIVGMAPDERAAKGMFLAFQYPLEIPGVATMTFLRTALNAQRRKRGEPELQVPEFMKRVTALAGKLGIDREMLRRAVNVGFSGGEKKRNEILQMALLEPQALRARRDRFRPRHRRAEGRVRGRQPAALARARLRGDHALSAAARLHRARHRPRAVQGPHRQDRRQGTGAGARGQPATRSTRTRRRESESKMNAEIHPIKTAAETGLAESFAAVRERLPGNGALADMRAQAFRRFAAEGLPHRRVEEWKYTDLRALMRDAKPLAGSAGCGREGAGRERGRDAGGESRRAASCSSTAPSCLSLSDLAALEPGLTIRSMAQALAAGDPLIARHLGKVVPTDNVAVALNTAFMGDGALIDVAPGTALARPIHLVFVNGGARPASVFMRSLVVVGEGARAMLVESHEGLSAGADYQVNVALDLVVGDEAHVDHVKVTGAGAGALHVSSADGGDRRPCPLQ